MRNECNDYKCRVLHFWLRETTRRGASKHKQGGGKMRGAHQFVTSGKRLNMIGYICKVFPSPSNTRPTQGGYKSFMPRLQPVDILWTCLWHHGAKCRVPTSHSLQMDLRDFTRGRYGPYRPPFRRSLLATIVYHSKGPTGRVPS